MKYQTGKLWPKSQAYIMTIIKQNIPRLRAHIPEAGQGLTWKQFNLENLQSLINQACWLFPAQETFFFNQNPWIIKPTAAAAAGAKLLQSCPTLCDPRDSSPPGSPVPGILQARTLEWVAITFSNAWKWKVIVKSLSHVQLLATPWTAAHQAPPSMRFSRQEYWSGVPLPSPSWAYSLSQFCTHFTFKNILIGKKLWHGWLS